MGINKDIYLKVILEQMPRLLGQINSNLASKTYGCCDRQYWHNNIVAIPNARFQEAVLTLALFYLNFDSPYRSQEYIRELVNAGISFWRKIQERSGAFNEWYLHEESYAATAFSSYAVSEALLLMGKERVAEYDSTVASLIKAGSWLRKRVETQACNQLASTPIVLYNIYLLAQDKSFEATAQEYEGIIADLQNKEGWLPEYGGADIGYLSLAIDYLGKYYQKTGSKKTEDIICQAIQFIANFLHNDGTSGGAYSSRHTEYLIPHGIEIFAAKNKAALYIAERIRENLQERKGVSIFSFDDRYLMYLSSVFLQAYLDGLKDIDAIEIERKDYVYFPEAELYVRRKKDLEVIANLRMLGSFVCNIGQRKICESGIVIEGRRRLFSGYLCKDVNIVKVDDAGFILEGEFRHIKEGISTLLRFILFCFFLLTIGRFSFVTRYTKRALRNVLILKQRTSRVRLKRCMQIEDGAVRITDEISGIGYFKRIIFCPKASYIYVPSSRFFQYEDIKREDFQIFTPKDVKIETGKLVICRDYS